MEIRKITHGFVIQVFDTEKGQWSDQEFVAGEEVEYDDCEGNPLTDDEFTKLSGKEEEPYLPFDMVQPVK